MENKIKRPYLPEATVRLLINYNKSQKTVLRVNPQLPLEMLLPLVCDKCELRLETAVLLRDRHSKESLDIAKTLNELGLREVFAQDTADQNPLLNHYQACTHEVVTRCAVHHMDLSAEKRKQKENRMFLSLCRRLKKKAEIKEIIVSSSSGVPKQKSAGVKQRDISYSNTLAGLPHQKRRAPLPPHGCVPECSQQPQQFQRLAEINRIGRKEGQEECPASSLWQQAAGSEIRHRR